MGTSVQKRAARDVDPGRGGSGESGVVRVGEVVVPLGARKENVMCDNDQVQKGAHTPSIPVLPEVTVKKIYLPSYKTEPDDVAWAQNGLVATIINGEAVPVVQSRIMDAGFNDVIIIPMGADKVFVRSSSGIDVKAIIDSAKEFFQIIFSSWTSWESHAQDYRRGAWVRLYGIPLQAWNENFFKLCVLDCG
ncbi:putative sulfate transporter, partial [Trifolium pratense]